MGTKQIIKLKLTTLIFIGGIPLLAAAAEFRNISGPTNFVGTVSAVCAETGAGGKPMIPVLVLDRPVDGPGPNGSTRKWRCVTLGMARPSGGERPIVGDIADPFKRWTGK